MASSSFFAALFSALGRYDVVHIHAEGPAYFAWLPKLFGKRVIVTVHGLDWQREKWNAGIGSFTVFPLQEHSLMSTFVSDHLRSDQRDLRKGI